MSKGGGRISALQTCALRLSNLLQKRDSLFFATSLGLSHCVWRRYVLPPAESTPVCHPDPSPSLPHPTQQDEAVVASKQQSNSLSPPTSLSPSPPQHPSTPPYQAPLQPA